MASQDLNVRLRPMRYAVLVPASLTWPRLKPLLELLSWIWGGRYSCLIPVPPKSLDERARIRLARFSPDIVLGYKVTGNAQGETVQQLVTVNGKGPATVNLNWR